MLVDSPDRKEAVKEGRNLRKEIERGLARIGRIGTDRANSFHHRARRVHRDLKAKSKRLFNRKERPPKRRRICDLGAKKNKTCRNNKLG